MRGRERRMNGRIAFGILLLWVAPGCASSPPPFGAPPPGPTPAPATYPWGISDCGFVIVSIPVDEDRLSARLPTGFELRPTALGNLPAGPRGTIELDAYTCRSGIGFNGSIPGVQYGSYYATVIPPGELREPDVRAYFVKWDFLVPDAERRGVFDNAGLPAHDGSGEVSIAGPGGLVAASLVLADAGGFRFAGTIGPLEPQAAPLPFMEYTPLASGGALAQWHARLHDARIGEGTGEVELLAGSWLVDVVGASRVPATAIAGVWNLDEADVTFPVVWPR